MANVTHHANKRMRERVGIPKRAIDRYAENALDNGLTHADCKGSLKRYIDSLYFRNHDANNIRIYNGNVYIFHDDVLITVLKLPKKYRKVERSIANEHSSDEPQRCGKI